MCLLLFSFLYFFFLPTNVHLSLCHLHELISPKQGLYVLYAFSSDRLMNTIWHPDSSLVPLLVYFCIGSRRGSLNVQFPFFPTSSSSFYSFLLHFFFFFSFFDSTTLGNLSIIYHVSLYWWIACTWLPRSNSKSDRCNSIRKLLLLLHLSSSILLILLLLHYTFDKFRSKRCNIFRVEGTVYICLYNWSLKCDSSSPSPLFPPSPPTSVVYCCAFKL